MVLYRGDWTGKDVLLKCTTFEGQRLMTWSITSNHYFINNLATQEILDNLITLKSFITDKLPNCKVVISTPTLRADDWKAVLTVSQLTNDLLQLDIDIIDSRNINARNLANKGLHLNPTGTSRLTKNLLSSIKSFRKAKGCPGVLNENNIEPEHPSFSIWFWNSLFNK